MPDMDLELNPVDFVTIGTVGPKGNRVFYLQAGKGDQIVSLVIEKFQAQALGEAINELLEDLDERLPQSGGRSAAGRSEELREPIEETFRVGQMGIGHDEESDLVILVAQEVLTADMQEQVEMGLVQPSTVRLWASRDMIRTLADRASQVVSKGRPDPHQNGKLINYWI